MELEESTYLISGSATKPQLSRQYGTGTKKYRSMEQNRKSRDKPTRGVNLVASSANIRDQKFVCDFMRR